MAVGFTALLNVLLVASLVYSEWMTLRTQLIGYAALAVVWLLSRWQSRAERRVSLAVDDEDAEQDGSTELLPVERDVLFREAQGHYLRNDWVATEQLLLKLLKQDARDIESRLMLATLWRHQGREAEALRQLDRLERFEAAENWQHEIAAERMAIEVAIEEADETRADETQADQEQADQEQVIDVSNANEIDSVEFDLGEADPKDTESSDTQSNDTDDRRRAA